jgi:hypothetical protein
MHETRSVIKKEVSLAHSSEGWKSKAPEVLVLPHLMVEKQRASERDKRQGVALLYDNPLLGEGH